MRFCCSPVCYILRSNVRSFGTSFVLRKVKPWQAAERSTTIWESVGVMLGVWQQRFLIIYYVEYLFCLLENHARKHICEEKQ